MHSFKMKALSNGALPLGKGRQGRKTSKEKRKQGEKELLDFLLRLTCGKNKYYQCSQLAYGEIVTLLDGGMNDGCDSSGGVLSVPKVCEKKGLLSSGCTTDMGRVMEVSEND